MSLDLFERPGYGEQAILVSVDFGRGHEESLQEFEELVVSAGAEPLATLTSSRVSPDTRHFIGSGKLEELKQLLATTGANVVLFNHELSASQERNLEKSLACRVLDRTGLILDIFAQRARSFEGKLQVELAQLKHLSTRLVRGWTHLERQKGGIGLRGPGETQLETDRRLLAKRMDYLQKRLAKVSQQRQQSRNARIRAEVPTVSLVGYTNAGKSTLFNHLTGADAYAQDQLFATLDPTIRRLSLQGAGHIVLADTVGFIRDLPHDLVAAFKSTLQETSEAALLLHVVDAYDEQRQFRIEQVNTVLEQIGANNVQQIIVYNKIDLSGNDPYILKNEQGEVHSVGVSAATGAGIELLLAAISDCFKRSKIEGWLQLAANEGRYRSLLFAQEAVVAEQATDDGGCILQVSIDLEQLQRIGIDANRVTPLDAQDAEQTTAVAGVA